MSVYHTKDKLFAHIDGIKDVQNLYDVCENIVIPVLENTEGLWKELGYCYKAVEVCNRATNKCSHFLETCQHAKTHEKVLKIKASLRKMAEHYHFLQMN